VIIRDPVSVDYTASCPECGHDAIWTGTLIYTVDPAGWRAQHVEVSVDDCLMHGFFHPIGV
jgi:hypothetical protein